MVTPQEFKTTRINLGYAKTELARRLGMSRSAMHNYENGIVRIPKVVEMAMKYEASLK